MPNIANGARSARAAEERSVVRPEWLPALSAVIYTGVASTAWVLADLFRLERLVVDHEVVDDLERIGGDRHVVVYFYVSGEPVAVERAPAKFKQRFPGAAEPEVRNGSEED